MIIRTEQIKKFLAESSVVRPNQLVTVNDLIKIGTAGENIIMTKTNGNVFCTFSFHDDMFNDDDELYLVNEKKLSAVAQTTSNETVSIEKSNGKIIIKAGRSEYVSFADRPVSDFPIEPEMSTGSSAQLSTEALYCIKVAGQYINTAQVINAASYVYVGEKGVLGSDAHTVVYHRKFDDLPEIILSSHALQVIDHKTPAVYSKHGNYDFFDYGELRFGVISSQVSKPLNPDMVFAGTAEAAFEVSKQALTDFCTMVGYATDTALPIGKIEYDGAILKMSVSDTEKNEQVYKEVLCSSNIAPCADFYFDLKKLTHLLKHLPYATLKWHRKGPHFWITSPDDEEYRGFFAGINK